MFLARAPKPAHVLSCLSTLFCRVEGNWVGKEMTAHFSFPKEMRCQACIKFLVFGVRGCPVT